MCCVINLRRLAICNAGDSNIRAAVRNIDNLHTLYTCEWRIARAAQCSKAAVEALTPGNAVSIAAALRLQPARLMSNMAMVRQCLNKDLKQEIGKLEYLAMSVGEVLCRFYDACSLEEVASLNLSEQNALLDVATAMAALFKWRELAVHQEMRQLFLSAAKGSCAGDVSDQRNALSCGHLNASEADALDDVTKKHASGHSVGAQGNFPAKGPHWDLLCFRNTDTEVKQRMVGLRSAMNEKLISEECVDKVLYALWESRALATASTCSAAAAVAQMDNMDMATATRQAAKQTDSEAGAAAAVPRKIPASLHEVAKAAKKAVRDVFLWRAAGEISGFDSRCAFDVILERYKFSTDARAQLGTGFTQYLGIKTHKPKRIRKQAGLDVAEQFGMPSDTDDRDGVSKNELLSPAILPPPGLEL